MFDFNEAFVVMQPVFNKFCIPESFNTNISHQLFDYLITFVNKQH